MIEVQIKELGVCRQCGEFFYVEGSACCGQVTWTAGCHSDCQPQVIGDDYDQTVGQLKLLLKNGLESS